MTTRLVGFYPGSFDPLTNGHLDVIERACKLVDTLVVAVGTHPPRSRCSRMTTGWSCCRQTLEPVGSADRDRVQDRRIRRPRHGQCRPRAHGAKLIIRGLRDTTDYNYEMQMVGMNAQMAPDLQTVFLPSSPHVRHISATLVRQIAELGGDISAFVPANVLKALKPA